MIVIRQPSELPQIQNEEIRDLIDRRIDDLCFDNYWNVEELGFFIVVEPEDSLEAINEKLGFPILSNRFTKAYFEESGFTPCFEILEEHPGFFAMLFIISDDGFGIEVFIPKADGVNADLLAMCRRYAVLRAT